MENRNWDTLKVSATGVVSNRACLFGGVLIGTDAINKPTITVHDNALAASGIEVLPTNTYDATAESLNGFVIGWPGIYCKNGLYLTLSIGGGVCEVTFMYRKLIDL